MKTSDQMFQAIMFKMNCQLEHSKMHVLRVKHSKDSVMVGIYQAISNQMVIMDDLINDADEILEVLKAKIKKEKQDVE